MGFISSRTSNNNNKNSQGQAVVSQRAAAATDKAFMGVWAPPVPVCLPLSRCSSQIVVQAAQPREEKKQKKRDYSLSPRVPDCPAANPACLDDGGMMAMHTQVFPFFLVVHQGWVLWKQGAGVIDW